MECHPYWVSQTPALLHLLSFYSEQQPFLLLEPAIWLVELWQLFFQALILSVSALLLLDQGVHWPVLLLIAFVLHMRMPRRLYHHLPVTYLKAKLTLPLPCLVFLVHVFHFSILNNFVN